MIRVTCDECGARLKAPEESVGKLCKCPRCKSSVRVLLPEVSTSESIAVEEPPEEKVAIHAAEPLPPISPPEKLAGPNRYIICHRKGVIAVWSPSSEGWKVWAGSGFVSPLMHRDLLPIEGDFRFVEVEIELNGIDSRLKGLRIFQLAKRYALITLDRGDNDVLKSITGKGALDRDHKNHIRQALREQLMPEVWSGAKTVLEFLGSTDYHSSVIREPEE